MTDFEFECLKRKRLARQAKYRKRGSKSRKCPMSTDYMTKKQWKERCGTVVSITIGKPVSWEDFKKMSKQTQEEYIKDLMDTYGANATSLAAMFNIRPLTVRRYITSAGLNIEFKVGHSMNAEQRSMWERFLNSEDAPPSNHVAQDAVDVPKEPPAMSMSKFSLSFGGKIDVNMIANSLLQILGENAHGHIDIICNLE